MGRIQGHRKAMLRNLASALFTHKKITTTEIRAKELARFAEDLITKARKGDLQAKRQVFDVIKDRQVARELFDVIAPRYNEEKGGQGRPGGYTRLFRVSPRKGDNAPMAVLELIL